MEKYKLAILPLLAGLILLFYSWYTSYPLSLKFPGDNVFNHISLLYWFSLPLVLGSLYIIAVFSKSHYVKCFAGIAILLTIYSLSFFYYSLPTSDSQYFRGLTQYFINTKNLDPSQVNHAYYQWPAFFLLADIATSVSGLQLVNYEFLLYVIIGSLLAITLYVYASKFYPKGALFAVVAFFVSMFYVIDYQAAPFSLALSLLFVLFMLETQKKSTPIVILMIVLLFSISITHSFVALFFISYLLIRAIVSKSKQYAELFLIASSIYFMTQFTISSYWLGFNVKSIFSLPSEYAAVAGSTLQTTSVPFDVIAQTMSRAVTIGVVVVSIVGFILLLIRRRLRVNDISILVAGAGYVALGFVLYTLGTRAIPILIIPVTTGVAYLFETRFRPYLIGIFLILLVLFAFIPLHASYTSFSTSYVPFQTKDEFDAENFFLNHYDWSQYSTILAHFPVEIYLASNLNLEQTKATISSDPSTLSQYDCVFYTVGLGVQFLSYNYTLQGVASEEKLDVVYNNGFSDVAVKGSSFSQGSS